MSSMNQLVRYQDHYSQHPEWWSTSSTSTMMQPCWSNSFNADGTPKSGDTFYHQYVQELFDTIMNAEIRHSYVFLGQEDNNNFCGCADCQELKEATGGTEAGLWVIFLNAISTEIKQKLRKPEIRTTICCSECLLTAVRKILRYTRTKMGYM